jgi:hypothetical protein
VLLAKKWMDMYGSSCMNHWVLVGVTCLVQTSLICTEEEDQLLTCSSPVNPEEAPDSNYNTATIAPITVPSVTEVSST